MKIVIRLACCLPSHMNGEYDLSSEKTIEEHLDKWEADMKALDATGILRVGYYTFRAQDPVSGAFQELFLRGVR